MVDEFEGEISVRGNPDITAQFFYVMRAMTVATGCQQRLEAAVTPEERREAARQGKAALAMLRESLERVVDLLDDPALPPNARTLFAETLANQQRTFESINARFAAALAAAGLSDI